MNQFATAKHAPKTGNDKAIYAAPGSGAHKSMLNFKIGPMEKKQRVVIDKLMLVCSQLHPPDSINQIELKLIVVIMYVAGTARQVRERLPGGTANGCFRRKRCCCVSLSTLVLLLRPMFSLTCPAPHMCAGMRITSFPQARETHATMTRSDENREGCASDTRPLL